MFPQVRWIVPGVTLVAGLLLGGCATAPRHFRMVEVSPGIYAGHRPWTGRDFEQLRAKGVRTILSLEVLPWDVWPERWQAHRHGLNYRNVPIVAAPIPPGEKQVKRALLELSDQSLRPIFVHCFLGEDRDMFIVGLYRVYFQGWTPQEAWDEMLRSHFHSSLRLFGLKSYFWRHSYVPAWARRDSRRAANRGLP